MIDMTHDKFAADALLAYSMACQEEYPALSIDLRKRAVELFEKNPR